MSYNMLLQRHELVTSRVCHTITTKPYSRTRSNHIVEAVVELINYGKCNAIVVVAFCVVHRWLLQPQKIFNNNYNANNGKYKTCLISFAALQRSKATQTHTKNREMEIEEHNCKSLL